MSLNKKLRKKTKKQDKSENGISEAIILTPEECFTESKSQIIFLSTIQAEVSTSHSSSSETSDSDSSITDYGRFCQDISEKTISVTKDPNRKIVAIRVVNSD